MEALDVVSSRENALDREAAFRSGDDAVGSSIGADVGPLDFVYASGFVVATVDGVGLLVGGFLVEERGELYGVVNGVVSMFCDHLAVAAFKVGLSLRLVMTVELGIVSDGFPLFLVLLVEGWDLFGEVGFPVVGQLADGFSGCCSLLPLWGIRSSRLLDIYDTSHVVGLGNQRHAGTGSSALVGRARTSVQDAMTGEIMPIRTLGR